MGQSSVLRLSSFPRSSSFLRLPFWAQPNFEAVFISDFIFLFEVFIIFEVIFILGGLHSGAQAMKGRWVIGLNSEIAVAKKDISAYSNNTVHLIPSPSVLLSNIFHHHQLPTTLGTSNKSNSCSSVQNTSSVRQWFWAYVPKKS